MAHEPTTFGASRREALQRVIRAWDALAALIRDGAIGTPAHADAKAEWAAALAEYDAAVAIEGVPRG